MFNLTKEFAVKMNKIIISIILIFLVSCSDYTSYKSKLIGTKFKLKNAFIYLKNLNQDGYNCYGRVLDVPIWLDELRFETNVIDTSCIFRRSTVRAELVPIGTEFEIKDSFMPGFSFVNKYFPINKVEYRNTYR